MAENEDILENILWKLTYISNCKRLGKNLKDDCIDAMNLIKALVGDLRTQNEKLKKLYFQTKKGYGVRENSEENNGKIQRIRRTNAELLNAAVSINKGMTYQEASEIYGIPMSTLRFFMARNFMLPSRKRGRRPGFGHVTQNLCEQKTNLDEVDHNMDNTSSEIFLEGSSGDSSGKVEYAKSRMHNASQCIKQGMTYQDASDIFNIPKTTLRIYMARNQILLSHRKRGRKPSI